MRFVDAVKLWAETTGNKFKIPRKGTPEYEEVIGIMEEVKKVEAYDAARRKASKKASAPAPMASAAAPAPAPAPAPKKKKVRLSKEEFVEPARASAAAPAPAPAPAPEPKDKYDIQREKLEMLEQKAMDMATTFDDMKEAIRWFNKNVVDVIAKMDFDTGGYDEIIDEIYAPYRKKVKKHLKSLPAPPPAAAGGAGEESVSGMFSDIVKQNKELSSKNDFDGPIPRRMETGYYITHKSDIRPALERLARAVNVAEEDIEQFIDQTSETLLQSLLNAPLGSHIRMFKGPRNIIARVVTPKSVAERDKKMTETLKSEMRGPVKAMIEQLKAEDYNAYKQFMRMFGGRPEPRASAAAPAPAPKKAAKTEEERFEEGKARAKAKDAAAEADFTKRTRPELIEIIQRHFAAQGKRMANLKIAKKAALIEIIRRYSIL